MMTNLVSSENASISSDGDRATDVDAEVVSEFLVVFNTSVVDVDQTTLNVTHMH